MLPGNLTDTHWPGEPPEGGARAESALHHASAAYPPLAIPGDEPVCAREARRTLDKRPHAWYSGWVARLSYQFNLEAPAVEPRDRAVSDPNTRLAHKRLPAQTARLLQESMVRSTRISRTDHRFVANPVGLFLRRYAGSGEYLFEARAALEVKIASLGFHVALARTTNNPLLPGPITKRPSGPSDVAGAGDPAFRLLPRVCDVVEAGDAPTARRAMRGHLSQGSERWRYKAAGASPPAPFKDDDDAAPRLRRGGIGHISVKTEHPIWAKCRRQTARRRMAL